MKVSFELRVVGFDVVRHEVTGNQMNPMGIKRAISLYEGLSLMCHHAWCNYSCRFPMHLHQPEAVLYHNCHDLVNLLLTSANFMDLHQGLYRDSVSGKLSVYGLSQHSLGWGRDPD